MIVLVEDNPDHAELVRRALARAAADPDVVWVRDGEEALELLESRGRHAGRPPVTPSVVLLDVKLPKLSGHAVLARIRATERLRGVGVVVMTTSARPDEIARSMACGADEHLLKSVRFDEFADRLVAACQRFARSGERAR